MITLTIFRIQIFPTDPQNFNTMPIRIPVGALPEAHRVICLRVVRALARGNFVRHGFLNRASKKCRYCTAQKEECKPVSGVVLVRNAVLTTSQIPDYVFEEFEILAAAIQAYDAGGGEDEEQEAELRQEVVTAATSLAVCVQVTRAQEKNVSDTEIAVGSYHLLQALVAQVEGLSRRVAELEGGGGKAVVSGGVSEVVGGQKRKAAGRAPLEREAKKAKGKGKDKAPVVVESDSEIEVPDDEEEEEVGAGSE